MFPFLQLPPELRSLVIEHVLFSSYPAPEYPSKENRSIFNDLRYMAWRARPYQEIRSTHSPSNCLALLLTSKTIHDETKAMLSLQESRSATYHLDITVENDNDVFPTWLCVPQLTTHIAELHVDVRLFGTIIHPNISWRLGGDGGHSRYEWDFLALLERFLRYGPVGQKKGSDGQVLNMRTFSYTSPCPIVDHGIKVDTLTLNFTSGEAKLQRGEFPPAEIEYRDWDWYRKGHGPRRGVPEIERPLTEYNTRPEWLAELLADEIDVLLHFGRDREGFARLVYERLRVIRMLVDGEVYREFDVSGILDEFKLPDKSLRKMASKFVDAPGWVFDL
ncbi:uncharacterized protein DSM5745_09553 [Aspergillus mulundensis]|uniref:F-box domain-containing protein n=1 Tax=Aspergillus mulundensis TaxID=1810919 RepID=A0A3D8QWB7_9EURO|nr:hypothetical protein DSM5745_09553 [Aspergillus mulundensis]RDW65814.1 hypothetical protein DSM5745_09553 [Aspergillus mulundensis]